MLASFFAHKCVQFVYLYRLCWVTILYLMWQVLSTSGDPVSNTLMVNVEQSAYPSVGGAFQSQFEGLLSHFCLVTSRLSILGEVSLTILTP